uniref:Serine carboxypeptidase S28 family protein n=2 Tax=Acrobeloides nanus TaxID=290746 RepID=A0A914DVB3_9BILA
MKLQNSIILFIVLLISYTKSINPKPRHIPQFVFGRPYGGFLNRPDGSNNEEDISCGSNNISYEEGWITQPLDHFDLNNTISWQQYYHYSFDLYNGSGLVFFMLGGETPLRARFICNTGYHWMVWAKQYGAAVFQIEHRYFGQSRPRVDQSVQNLQWFTPEQILEDYNDFIQQMNVKFFSNITKPRWVMFGGSYPGTLTAWMRTVYPDLTIGGIASSGAIGLTVNQYSYAVNMQKDYGSNDPNCASNIKAAFTQMQTMVYSETGRQVLEILFNLCTPFPSSDKLTPKDIQFFFSNIFGVFQGINQYTGDNGNTATANGLGIPITCQIMNNVSETDLVKRIANVINWSNSFSPGSQNVCMPNSYSDYIWTYKQPEYDTYAEIAAARSWNWMCCSYMGYFQTTDGGHDNDIWGRQDNLANNVTAMIINRNAHCADMYPSSPNDNMELIAARTRIQGLLEGFIQANKL